MFEIHKPQYINKTVRMSLDMIQTLEAIAKEKDVSFNQVVIQCCAYALGRMEPENKGEGGE